ncbi:hypothetical protein H0H93_003120, partial [Arthromyces matolae]
LVTIGQNNMRASQARLSTNILADQAVEYFEGDYDLEEQYHTMLDGNVFFFVRSKQLLMSPPQENGTSTFL